jgi:hypothetical protein
VTASRRSLPQPEPTAAPPGGPVIVARLAWAVLVVVLAVMQAAGLMDAVVICRDGALTALVAAATVLVMALQLHHARSALDGSWPRAWPLPLGLQAALVYAFFLPFLALTTLAPFLAGSVLLLVPGRWRWAGYAAVIPSWSALYARGPLLGFTASDHDAPNTLYVAASIAQFALPVYGAVPAGRLGPRTGGRWRPAGPDGGRPGTAARRPGYARPARPGLVRSRAEG